MKTHLMTVAAIGLLALIGTGCKPSTRTDFTPAAVSIDVGEGWKRLDITPDSSVSVPTLVGRSGLIHALSLGEDVTDPKAAAEKMQSAFAGNEEAIKDSFKQEDFTTDTGLTGVHVSYTAKSAKSDKPDLRSHNFVVINGRRRCISISYITSPTDESPAVLAAIQKTLRAE